MLLAGEAGVGKSRLVRALLDEPAPAQALVLRSQCVDVGEPGLPYLALVDLARAVREEADADPEVADVLAAAPLVSALADGTAVGDDPADETRPLRVFDATTTLLRELGRRRGPVVVVVEDLQWLDASSAAFLRFLLSRMGPERLLVVATVRTEGLAGRPRARGLLSDLGRLTTVHRLDLEPLAEEEVAALVAHVTGSAPSADVAADVSRRTGGNAYFVRTLAAGLDRAGNAAGMPRALADLLVGRLDRLADEPRAVVQAAAVIGHPVPDRLLRRLVGLDEATMNSAVRLAMAGGLLTTVDGAHALPHDLQRAAVYDDLLPGERERLHAAYAAALESGTYGQARAAEVAHHVAAAQDGPRTLVWSVRAAEEAIQVLAPTEALSQLDSALAAWPDVEDAPGLTGLTLAALTARAARAAGLAGEIDRAIALAGSAVRLCDPRQDPVTAVRARAELARSLIAADSTDGVVRPAREAVAIVEAADVDASTTALAQVVLARALLAARRTDEARPQVERAVAAARAAGATALEVDALTTAAFVDEVHGDRAGAADRLRSALLLARSEGELAAELRVHFTLASLHYYNGDVAGSLPVLDAGMGRAAETGLRWSASGIELRLLRAVARYAAGDLEGSLEAARPPGERPPDVAAARLGAVRCYPAVALGLPEAALRLADLRDSWDADPQVALVAGGCEADLLTWEGEPGAAVEVAERAQSHLDAVAGEGMYGGLWLSALGLAALADIAAGARQRRDDAAVAEALARGEVLRHRVERIVEGGRGRPGQLGPEGRAWHVRALAEHSRLLGEAAVDRWQAALDAFAYGHAYERARCHWRLAEALVAAGDRHAARTHAEAAASAADRMGAAPLLRAVAATVASARLSANAGSAATVLTTRERDVLALVAEGLTNREVGRRLFISEKTVSVHLSNLMAKLNVSSRTEAVTVAMRRGLLDVQGA